MLGRCLALPRTLRRISQQGCVLWPERGSRTVPLRTRSHLGAQALCLPKNEAEWFGNTFRTWVGLRFFSSSANISKA